MYFTFWHILRDNYQDLRPFRYKIAEVGNDDVSACQ